MRNLLFVFPLLLACLSATAKDEHPSQDYLWYKQPAIVPDAIVPWADGASESGNLPGKKTNDSWESQTLPIGNGRVGGTVFGGDRRERINLNETSLWTGGPNKPGNGSGYGYGPLAGKDQFGSYQPFGNLYLEFKLDGNTTEYSRSLDLRDAIARVAFKNDGVKYERECFVSEPDNLLVYMAKADKKGAMNVKIALTPNHTVSYSKSKNSITMSGTLANGEKFEGKMVIKAKGGKVTVKGKAGSVPITEYVNPGKHSMTGLYETENMPYIEVAGSEAIVLYVSLATDYKMDYNSDWKGKNPDVINESILDDATEKNYAELRRTHIEHYQSLFNRLKLSLGKTPAATANLATDERIAAYKDSGFDPELEATIYQYGRYVLIAGSRPGNLPVTLQGIWNDKVHAPWACDYHNNINIEMCYWGAEVGNLSECHMPFINYMKAMEEPLSEMTRKNFGPSVKGWVTRISQNPWGGGGWVKWNTAVNAWYALHVWEHYTFTQDKKYLKELGYPLLKDFCSFWETRLKEIGAGGEGLMSDGKPIDISQHPELKDIKAGSLVSPEGWSHEWGSECEDGVTLDQQLIWELFDNTAKAAKILGVDAGWAKKLISLRDRLVPSRVAKGGYIQEWIIDRPGQLSGHRHTSHLVGVYPGSIITEEKEPELYKAAAKSLELRGLEGDNRRNWACAWRTALWARLGETDKSYNMVQRYIKLHMLDNLFGNHPPMQMDSTYGMTGGMSEMLVQSHGESIKLIPALPDNWKNGYVKGIRARGDITIDIEWRGGRVTKYKLSSDSTTKPVKVEVNGKLVKVTPKGAAAGDDEADEEAKPKKKKGKKKKKKKKKKS